MKGVPKINSKVTFTKGQYEGHRGIVKCSTGAGHARRWSIQIDGTREIRLYEW